MVMNDASRSCAKCQKAVKDTEKVLVCGLWCRRSFHSDCVGLGNSETRVVTCLKERIKFHCDTCEIRLGTELSGQKETHEAIKLENCANNCLLELIQKILELTNELSNDNSVINAKLDTVISSNARLEEYVLQSPKCYEERSGETTVNSVEYVESFSGTGTLEISKETDDTNFDSCASNLQQIGMSSTSLHITSDVPKQLSSSQQQNFAEECSSNCLQEWEVSVHHSNTQDALNTDKEDCLPSEDFAVHDAFSIEKTEFEGDNENAESGEFEGGEEKVDSGEFEGDEESAETEMDKENCLPSEDFAVHDAFRIEKTEFEGGEDNAESGEFEGGEENAESGEFGGDAESAEAEMDKEECSPSEDFLLHTILSIEKTECEVGEQKAESEIDKEECSPSEDFLRLNTFSFEKIEEYEGGEVVGEDNLVELSHAVESTSSGNQPESSVIAGMEDNRKKDDNSSLITKVSQAAREGQQETSCRNKGGRSCVVHRCDICKRTFMNLQELKEHTNRSRHKLRHSCIVCHKTFTCRSSLEKHFIMHTRESKIALDVCNKTLKEKTTLQRQSQVHPGDRPYGCSICSRAFKRKNSLQDHILVHTDERPHSCIVCNKTFKYTCNLQRHSKLHSAERQYSCSICSKAFKQKTILQRHSRLHSGKCLYSCGICDKTFVHQSELYNHLQLHTT